MTAAPIKTSNELAADRTNLSVTRTMMASERTLMSWIRTALAFYSFGFTIYKVLQDFRVSRVASVPIGQPRLIGLVMSAIGLISMIMGTIEYRVRIAELRRLGSVSLWRTTFFMAIFMCLVGIFLFFGIISKIL